MKFAWMQRLFLSGCGMRLTPGRGASRFRARLLREEAGWKWYKSRAPIMKTYSAKTGEVEAQWHVIDAEGKVLGAVAVEAARLLRGKHKTTFTPHIDTGDHVVIVNAEKVVLSGTKEWDKIYTRYTGYVGGQKVETPRKVRERRPELLVERAVKGMVPKTKLGRQQLKKLRVVIGAEHPHEAQNPQPYEVK